MLDVRADAEFQRLVHSPKLPLYVKQLEQYALRDAAFELVMKSSSSLVRSETLIGFAIPIIAIFDRGENLRMLRDITQTPSEEAT